VIAVTSSVAGKIGTPLRTAYCASKHALHGFYESLRAEVFKSNIQITLVCPGFIQTNISANARTGEGKLYGKNDPGQISGMAVQECARRYLKAIELGKEEVIISKSKEKFAVWLNRFYPAQLRRMIRRMKVT
jgi:short-subunit dehydrogenase